MEHSDEAANGCRVRPEGWDVSRRLGYPPIEGDSERKILVFNGFRRDYVCKILKTKGLRTKYLLSITWPRRDSEAKVCFDLYIQYSGLKLTHTPRGYD